MTAPRLLARFNRRVTNNVTRLFAADVPGFGIIVHTGRETHREYRTPVNVFRTPAGFAVALPYGPRTQWLQNVMASGVCTLETRGQRWRLVSPQIVHDEQRQMMPPLVRRILGLLGVSDFLTLAVDTGGVSRAA